MAEAARGPDRRAPPGRPPRDPLVDAAGERARRDPRAHAGADRDLLASNGASGPARGGARARRRRRPAAAAADRQRRLRDPQGRPRRQAADRARQAPARPDRHRVLAQGRNGQDRHGHEPRHLAREALGQAGAPARPRPPVRRRRDHARDRAGEDDLRPRRRPGRARLGEARRLHHASRVRARRPAGATAPRGRRARDGGEAGPAAGGGAGVVRRDRRRHLAVLPRADAGDARPHRRAAAALRAGRADAEERAAQPADARAALVPARPDPLRPQPRQLEGRDEAEGGRGGARAQDRLRDPERPDRPARGEPRQAGRDLRPEGRVRAGVRAMAKELVAAQAAAKQKKSFLATLARA